MLKQTTNREATNFVQIEFNQKKFIRFTETFFETNQETGAVSAGTQDYNDLSIFPVKYIYMKTL